MKIIRIVLFLIAILVYDSAYSCPIPENIWSKIITRKVITSWYGREFHGQKMANGEKFNMHEISAAHKKLPFGKQVFFENLENGRSLIVTIKDRGPYILGRDFDLSYAAAKKLGFIKKGLAQLRASYMAED